MSPSTSEAVAAHVSSVSETTLVFGVMVTASTVGLVLETVIETETLCPKSVPSSVVTVHKTSSSTSNGPLSVSELSA